MIITNKNCPDRRRTERFRNIHFAVAILGSLLCLGGAPAAESGSESFNPKPEAPAGRGIDAPNACASGYALNENSRTNHERPTLRVPLTDSKPVVDGRLDEPCWKHAAKTGPLAVLGKGPARSNTEAFVLRDADHLYVGVICPGMESADGIDRDHTEGLGRL